MPKDFIDFAKLRKDYPILDVATKLGIKVRQKGATQHRGQCPFPDCGHISTFVITTNGGSHRNGWCGCHKCGRNGMDVIRLVRRLKDYDSDLKAAKDILELMGGKAHEPEEQGLKEAGRSFQPLSPDDKLARLKKVAEDLDPDHERLTDTGITPETAVAFVAGYTGRGTAKGNVIVQLHDTKGTLIGYVGLEDPMWMPKDIAATAPEHLFNWHRVVEGKVKLLASPIEVLRFLEMEPDSQAVCFLTPEVTPTQLGYYKELLAQKGCTHSP